MNLGLGFDITKSKSLGGGDVILFKTTMNGLFTMNINAGGGTVDIDWGDGNTTLGHASGNATNTYADGTSKDIVVTGDTGSVTQLFANTQEITVFNPEVFPNASTINFNANLCVSLDFTNNINLSNLDVITGVNLTSCTLPTHGILVSNIRISSTKVTTLDFTPMTKMAGSVGCNNNSLLTTVIFGDSTDVVTNCTFHTCNITGSFDSTKWTKISNYSMSGNPLLTEFVVPTTTHPCTSINFASCGITVNPNVSTMNLTGECTFRNNSGITDINIGAITTITNFRSDLCALSGQSGLDQLNGLTNVELQGNAMTQAEVDAIVSDMYGNRLNYTDATPVLNIGGTNSAPTGTFQIPGACPAIIANERVYELVNDSCGDGHQTWAITTS